MRSEQMLKFAKAADEAGLSKTKADLNRAATDVYLRKQERNDLQGKLGGASARLVRYLGLKPSVNLVPSETEIVPVLIVPGEHTLEELFTIAIAQRADLTAQRALSEAVAAAFADRWKFGDTLVLARYTGRADLSRHAAEVARANGLDTLVSDSRAILADFFYTLRDSGLALYAAPVDGFPPNHYVQKYPLPPGPGDVLLIGRPPVCRDPNVTPELVASWTPASGYRTDEVQAFRVPRRCWFPEN